MCKPDYILYNDQNKVPRFFNKNVFFMVKKKSLLYLFFVFVPFF